MKDKLKWMMILVSFLWMSITFTGCSALRNYTPSDGVVYNGGTILIVNSNGYPVLIKK